MDPGNRCAPLTPSAGTGLQVQDSEPASCRVLLVDADPLGRRLMSSILRRSFRAVEPVVEAHDLTHAREVLGAPTLAPELAQAPLQLLLCETHFPDGSCQELLADLRSHPCKKVIVTLQQGPREVLQAFKSGADGYLLKQEPSARLVEDLQRLSVGQPALSVRVARSLLEGLRQETQITEPSSSQPGSAPRAYGLSPRETEVLQHLSRGLTIREMALAMQIRWFTVNDHLKAIYRKLGVNSRAEAAVIASQQGLA